MTLKYNACHGTSVEAKASILNTLHFYESNTNGEWAGSGIYFFIEENECENAKRWALYVKRFSDIAVINAEIEIEQSLLFDLTNATYQMQFHKFRELYYKNAKRLAEENGKEIDNTVLKKLDLDCHTINKICSKLGFTAVKRRCYIKFLNRGFWRQYPSSDIPNCTILCVRNESHIKSIC